MASAALLLNARSVSLGGVKPNSASAQALVHQRQHEPRRRHAVIIRNDHVDEGLAGSGCRPL